MNNGNGIETQEKIIKLVENIRDMDSKLDHKISEMEKYAKFGNEYGLIDYYNESMILARNISETAQNLMGEYEGNMPDVDLEEIKRYTVADKALNSNLASIFLDLAFNKIKYEEGGQLRYAPVTSGIYVDNEGIVSCTFNGSFVPIKSFSMRGFREEDFNSSININQKFETKTEQGLEGKIRHVYIDDKEIMNYKISTEDKEEKSIGIDGENYILKIDGDRLEVLKEMKVTEYGAHEDLLGKDGMIYHKFEGPEGYFYKNISIQDFVDQKVLSISNRIFMELDTPETKRDDKYQSLYRERDLYNETKPAFIIPDKNFYHAFLLATYGFDPKLLEKAQELGTHSSMNNRYYVNTFLKDMDERKKQALDWNLN